MSDEKQTPARYLKGSKHTSLPKRVICLACTYVTEQSDIGNGCRLMTLSDYATITLADKLDIQTQGVKMLSYKGVPPMYDVMGTLNPKCENWIVSNRLGRDLTLLAFWYHVESGEFSFEHVSDRQSVKAAIAGNSASAKRGLLVASDIPTIIAGWWRGIKVVMVDLRNYGFDDAVRGSLDEQMPEMAEVDRDSDDRHRAEAIASLLGYATGRATAILKMVAQHDMGKLRYTYSSQAYECYKHRFMRHKILIHQNKQAKDIEGKAIFGVPSIAYFSGQYVGRVYKLDVQGLYPSVMRDGMFPIKLVRHELMTGKSMISTEEGWLNKIALVSVKTGRVTYPKRIEDGTIYPIGRYCTTLCGEELDECIGYDRGERLGTVLTYDLAPIFTDYVNYWWNERMQSKERGKPGSANWAKLTLVSLWGKFGQRSVWWEDCPEVHAAKQWGYWWHEEKLTKKARLYRGISWRTQTRVDKGYSRESFPAIAAFVCMYARKRMDQLKEIAGDKQVLLQIADCLYVTEVGREALEAAGEIKQGQLGKLKEVDQGDKITIYSAYDYSYGDDEVISGVKISGVKVSDTRYVETQESTLPLILTGDPAVGVRLYEVLKTIKRKDPPGRIGSDGWISPPVLEDW